MLILKEEINNAGSEALELFKWKLVAVAAAGVVGLGWGDLKPDGETGRLLTYVVGFLCGYIDWLYYRRLTVVHTIAAYIRNYEGNDADLKELSAYEKGLRAARVRGRFYFSERWAAIGSSVVFSLGLPGMAMIRYAHPIDGWAVLPVVAAVCNIILFVVYDRTRAALVAK